LDKSNYHRVTEIISPFSGIGKIPSHILQAAAHRGSMVHNYIEAAISGFAMPPENDAVQPYIDSFEGFWDESRHVFDGKWQIEKRLFCDKKMITGQMDLIVKTDEKTLVFDWKTSAKEQKSWRLQAAAYQYLLEVNEYKNPKPLVFVRLDKFGKKPTLHSYETYKEDLDIFFKCLDLYHWFDHAKDKNDNFRKNR